MLNLKLKTGRISRDDPRSLAAYNGWHDALNQRPLNPYYSDHPKPAIAATYIHWRLRATEIKRVHGKVPVWRTTRQVPHQVYTAFAEVIKNEHDLGNLPAIPGKAMPDNPDLKFS